VESQTFYQLKLLNKILKKPITSKYLIDMQNDSNWNFFPYFLTLLLGLGDPSNRELYLRIFCFDKIYPGDLYPNTLNSSNISLIVPLLYRK
jgi:hypothetical protein